MGATSTLEDITYESSLVHSVQSADLSNEMHCDEHVPMDQKNTYDLIHDMFLQDLLDLTDCWSPDPTLELCNRFAAHVGNSSANFIHLQNMKKKMLVTSADQVQYLGHVDVDPAIN